MGKWRKTFDDHQSSYAISDTSGVRRMKKKRHNPVTLPGNQQRGESSLFPNLALPH